ncbi:MAG: ATPase [Methanomicrobiales archaeon]|nr:ATPase [Methanomicrobiales archaeon]
MISEARAEREKMLAEAKLEADNLVIRASEDAEEYKKKRLSDARDAVAKKRAGILKTGEERAMALKARGMKNLDRAVALLITRFREQLHAES